MPLATTTTIGRRIWGLDAQGNIWYAPDLAAITPAWTQLQGKGVTISANNGSLCHTTADNKIWCTTNLTNARYPDWRQWSVHMSAVYIATDGTVFGINPSNIIVYNHGTFAAPAFAGLPPRQLFNSIATTTLPSSTTLYASPTGGGSLCTKESPCSLSSAQAAVIDRKTAGISSI